MRKGAEGGATAASGRKPTSDFPAPKQRTFVKAWTVADFAADEHGLAMVLTGVRHFRH